MSTNTVAGIIAVRSPSDASDPRLADLEALAGNFASQTFFGDQWVYAKALIILHFLSIERQTLGSTTKSGSGEAGGVRMKKEGQLEMQYRDPKTKEGRAFWAQTTFGLEYLTLVKTKYMPFMNRFINR